jgi:hypothetical protein
VEIRGDFQSVASWLQRLLTYAETFRKFNNQDWSHLKNREDYSEVYLLPNQQQLPLHAIYANGRDIAVHMSGKLTDFNYAEEYPTLKSFVDSFNHGWISQTDLLEKQVDDARAVAGDLPSSIWAVDQMIDLYLRQIGLLHSIAQCLTFLRNSELYQYESGNLAPNPQTLAYQEILECLNIVGKMFERLPRTYAGKDEEGLRDHMLVTLEASVGGSATGETFNRRGKTDILVRTEGNNTFIAECKFWSGQKGLLETIDQLLTYLGWRDNQASAIIFVRNVNFSETIESAKAMMKTHPKFIRHLSNSDSTWDNYEFRSAADPGRSVSIALMVYHLHAG